MQKDIIEVPERGTYKWTLFNYWSDEFKQTQADHTAYIALNFAGALDSCRSKLQTLMNKHSKGGARNKKAIERLQRTMSGAAMAYESGFRR